MLKSSFSKWCYLTHNWEDKGVHAFPKGICPKVSVIARLEFELAYLDFAVHHFNHCTTRTLPSPKLMFVTKTTGSSLPVLNRVLFPGLTINQHLGIRHGMNVFVFTPPPTPWIGGGTRSIWSRLKLVWIQNFPSPRLVVLPRLKNPINPFDS